MDDEVVTAVRDGRRSSDVDVSPRSGDKPLYEQVDNIIRQRLIENVWKPGDALPSEMQLAKELSVSQGTVRKALNDLVAENLLYRRQGRGTFVSEHTERRALFLYFNLIGNDGYRQLPVSRLLGCDYKRANKLERERLNLKDGDRVIRVTRVRSLRDVPVIYEVFVLPLALFPGLGKDIEIPDHLYRSYQSQFGITVARAEERARAVNASATQAALLGIKPGTALLEIDRVAFSLDGRPVEWRLSRCHTADYSYRAERG